MVLLALGGALIIGAAVALVNSGARGTGGPLASRGRDFFNALGSQI